MKGMEGRFLKKLKLNPTISRTLKQGLFLQLNPPQHTFSNQNCQSLPVYKDHKTNVNHLPEPVIDDFKDQKDEETDLGSDVGDRDNLTPSIEFKDIVTRDDHSQPPISSEITVKDDSIHETVKVEAEEHPSLTDFEEKCPPGGEESVILYTTSLRGIRKTFEDCSSIRFLLHSFKVLVHERDVSMDMEFREQLWRLFGGRVVPPKLFIKGRYIGGADEVIVLHEQGKLKKLLEGMPSSLPNCPCASCANIRFLVCSNCNGSRKIFAAKEGDELCMKCPDCNENGLVKCPVCY